MPSHTDARPRVRTMAALLTAALSLAVPVQQESVQAQRDSPGQAEIARAIGQETEAETVYKVLEHLSANARGVVREGGRAPDKARYRRG